MDRATQAVEVFKQGYNCAQAVFATWAVEQGMERDAAIKLATGFGAGMGRAQHVCGALSGAILALGQKYGRNPGEEKSAQDRSYAKVRELLTGFEEEHGSVNCRELLDGINLLEASGQERFRAEGLSERCHNYIASAARLLENLTVD